MSDLQRLINQVTDKAIAEQFASENAHRQEYNAALRAALQRHEDIAIPIGEHPDLP